MSKQSQLAALRELAERPGTPEEGALAREILRRLEAKYREADEDEDAEETNEFFSPFRPPKFWHCACGARLKINEKCGDITRHEAIRAEIRERFKRGDRVFLNDSGHPMNYPGCVTGYPRERLDNWHWVRIKFDELKNPQGVPIHSKRGWHLMHAPLPIFEANYMRYPAVDWNDPAFEALWERIRLHPDELVTLCNEFFRDYWRVKRQV